MPFHYVKLVPLKVLVKLCMLLKPLGNQSLFAVALFHCSENCSQFGLPEIMDKKENLNVAPAS
jgi:hypothetical protein